METPKATISATAVSAVPDRGDHRSVVIELPLCGATAATFNLEKAVCSHGLFMMAPNHWDPLTKTLHRPLRLSLDIDEVDDYETSLLVGISQPSDSPHAIRLRVLGTAELSAKHQEALLAQVRRMLHLSEEEDQLVRDFHEVYAEAKERGFGRVFRSPTLFEDMVKCILLCNCQWSRTLSMAEALCDLQSELHCPSSIGSFVGGNGMTGNHSANHSAKAEHFVPRTPAGKESKIKHGHRKRSKNLANRFEEVKATIEASELFQESGNGSEIRLESNNNVEILTSNGESKADSFSAPSLHSSEGTESHSFYGTGNFPSPRELAKVDERVLGKLCGLGYRASRIWNLARGVVEGSIQLRELEEACSNPSLSNYEKLAEKLKEINGFGPFTCANVLMCMGFYHVIPTDSETLRHLKQVHARNSTIQTVQREVETIYGKYSPFQFLAYCYVIQISIYWICHALGPKLASDTGVVGITNTFSSRSEIWHFYEEWFGKMSEMPRSEYKLITAANMRPNRKNKDKRAKTSRDS